MKAAIDIGSNSVRLGINGTKRSVITKLADGIATTGRLSPSGVKATLDAVCSFVKDAEGADIKIFATEAVRRAADGKEFTAELARLTGHEVIVLSAEQEAACALKGAKKPSGAVSVCDLGGGSMELISAKDGINPDYIKSLPLGVVVLKNMFDGDYRKAIDAAPALVEQYGETKNYPLVMIGGSACSLAAAALDLPYYDGSKVNGTYISSAMLDDMMPMLLSPKLAVFRPVCAKRADTLPYGAIIIQALLNKLGLDGFTVSDGDNLDAMIDA